MGFYPVEGDFVDAGPRAVDHGGTVLLDQGEIGFGDHLGALGTHDDALEDLGEAEFLDQAKAH